MRIAVCPGSFDPITNGHLDVIERAGRLYDKVVVGVVEKPEKPTLFSIEERLRLARNALKNFDHIEVKSYNCLLVDFVRSCQAQVIIRGLRAISDFEREFQIAQFNKKLAPEIETLFMMARPEYAYLSASAVKEIAEYGGCLKGLVPEEVEKSLSKFYSQQEPVQGG